MKTIIKCENLWYIYPDGTEAVRGVNLEIRQGEFCAIIGQNGSGKTTLVKHFNGLLRPSRGECIVLGMNTKKASIAQLAARVGYVFQNPDHQICCKTVEEEMLFGPKNLELPKHEAQKRVESVLKIFALDQFRDLHPYYLSKADRLRLAICSILVMEPEVIVVDEPTTGQDMRQSYEVMKLLNDLNKNGRTVIFITHNMQLVAEYAKRTIVMVQGKILMDSLTEDIFANPDILAKAFLKAPQITQLAQMLTGYGIPPGILSVEQLYIILKKILERKGLEKN